MARAPRLAGARRATEARGTDVRWRPIMRSNPLRLPRRFSLSWLMWLALLLPLAQSAAQWHGLSHWATEAGAADLTRQTGGRTDGQAAGHALGCDLCLAGAALDSGSLLSTLPGLLLPTVRHAAPLAAGLGVWLPPLARAYLSRAPPAPR